LNLGTRIDWDGLAAIAGLSNCHFARAFKQSLGLPPHRYVMERRLEAAAKLIRKSHTTLAEIAVHSAFAIKVTLRAYSPPEWGALPLSTDGPIVDFFPVVARADAAAVAPLRMWVTWKRSSAKGGLWPAAAIDRRPLPLSGVAAGAHFLDRRQAP
jgi:hypothetical protein